MEFEYDPAKSASNKDKHGIDFEEAQRLWLDEFRLEVPTAWVEENRLLAIGKIGEKVWTAVFVHRSPRIRLISVRRARAEEVRQYEKNLFR
ncbi:MAG: BrnT family toxin [Rhizobiaceae bacterium]